MLPLHRLTRTVAALALGGLLLGRLQAADAAFANPFARDPAAAGGAPTNATPDAPLELRGIMTTGEGTMFSIYDPTRRSATWTKLNELGRDYIVRTYDAAKDTVTLDYQGRTLTLVLHTAKVSSAPVAPMPIASSPMPAALPPVGGPVVLNPTPADEQRRLEAIAAEVNRRRMIRQQALQASRQQIQPQPGAAPPPPPEPGAQR